MLIKVNGVAVDLSEQGGIRAALDTFDQGSGVDLSQVVVWAIGVINQHAGEQRSLYATDIPFQGDLYQLKEREAIAYQSDPNGQYPILLAEAAARGITPADLATEYLANAALFPQILAAIEAVRMTAITALKSAASITDIETALASVTWPTF